MPRSRVDKFEIEFGDRLRSIGFDDSRLVFEAAHKALISPEKGVAALVKWPVPSDLGDYIWIVLEDIGLFSWLMFCKELGVSESQIRTKKFCWLPTAVYDGRNYRAGVRWLSYAWLDRDGRYYKRSAEWLTYIRKKLRLPNSR